MRMALRSKLVSTLLALAALPAVASAAVIGGTYYATQYDFREFFAATDGRNFQVILAGNAFPGLDPNAVARDLLPAMQAGKPRPGLTFPHAPPPGAPASPLSAGAHLQSDPRPRLVRRVHRHDARAAAAARAVLRLRRLLPQRSGLFRDDR